MCFRKQIMSIVSNSEPLEAPKDPSNCNIFALYSLLADQPSITEMKGKYEKGGYGYGHAKQELYELIVDKFKAERSRFDHLMENRNEIDESLEIGAKKARIVAQEVLQRVRLKSGYHS